METFTKKIEELAGHRRVPPWVMKLVADAVAEEREACAKLCEDFDVGVLVLVPITRGQHVLANAIRARS